VPRLAIVQGGVLTWYTVVERSRISLEAGCACCPVLVEAVAPQAFSVSSGRASLTMQADTESSATRWVARLRAASTPFVGVAPAQPPADEEAETWLELFLADPADQEAHDGLDRALAHWPSDA